MLKLSRIKLLGSVEELALIPDGKVLINTINAHSYNVAQKDKQYAESLIKGDYLIPDGESIVKACRWLKAKSQPKERIAGWDLFTFEMGRLDGRWKREEGDVYGEFGKGAGADTGTLQGGLSELGGGDVLAAI